MPNSHRFNGSRIIIRPHLGLLLVLMGLLAPLLIAACNGSDPTAVPLQEPTLQPAATNAPQPTAAPTAMAEPTATSVPAAIANASLAVSTQGSFGPHLVDSNGMTLYLYTKDERNVSNCSGGCADAWPPLLTGESISIGDGLDSERISTFQREDGTNQVTYNGEPLYYFANDKKAGDTLGQDRGDVWYLVSTDGGPIQTAATVNAVENSPLGTILVDSSGNSLYLYTKDERNVSNCAGGCALAWPPLLTVDAPVPGEGLAADRIGTISRGDGSSQVTYNGWPLYYFAADAKPGDAVGQDRGGVWFVVTTDGGAVYTSAPVNSGPNGDLGTILTDAAGRSLYLYTKDEPNVSNCSGGCALAWPPLITVTDPEAGEGVSGGLISTTTREDGSNQVTYDGDPLYYFAADEKPGDVLGQNRGEVWFVISVSKQPTASLGATADDTLYESSGNQSNNGAGQWFFVGKTGAGAIRRGLLQFDIANGLPADAEVTGATLTLNMSRSVAGGAEIGLHRILGSWQEGKGNAAANEGSGAEATAIADDVTWTQRAFGSSDWEQAGGDFATAPSAVADVGNPAAYVWESTDQLVADVQEWLDNPASNFGWLLQGDESSSKTAKRFDSKENPNEDSRPVLVVEYRAK